MDKASDSDWKFVHSFLPAMKHDIKTKRFKWIGHLMGLDRARVVKILRVNWREEEWQDLDWDDWKMLKRTYRDAG